MVFSISIQNLINFFIIAVGIGVCALTILQLSSAARLRKEVKRYFRVFFSLIIVYILSHLLRQTMDGLAGEGIRTALYVVTFLEFMATGFMAYLISMLVLFIAKAKRPRVIGIVFLALLVVNIVLLVVSQFTDLYYYFDSANVYHRGSMYILSNLSQALMMGLDIYLLLRYRKKFDRKLRPALWTYLIAPLVAIIIQMFIKDIQFIIVATVGGAFYMYAVIMQELTEQYQAQREANSRIEAELNMASSIQAEMLPNIFPAFPDRKEFDIFASMNPAKEVGGDFYDFFLVDDEHLGIVMADVSGKGVPAALFMMASKILIQNFTMLSKSPKEVLETVNNQICSNNKEDMFVTVWLGILDLKTGELRAANAGHEYPVLKDADGNFELVHDKHGLVIGGMEGVPYREYTLQMKPGSKLFLYTDGVPEATNASEELFGAERMVEALRSAEDESPKVILESVDKAVSEFVKDAPQFDDLTMLCLHYKG